MSENKNAFWQSENSEKVNVIYTDTQFSIFSFC